MTPNERVFGGVAGYRPRVRSAYYERVYVHSPEGRLIYRSAHAMLQSSERCMRKIGISPPPGDGDGHSRIRNQTGREPVRLPSIYDSIVAGSIMLALQSKSKCWIVSTQNAFSRPIPPRIDKTMVISCSDFAARSDVMLRSPDDMDPFFTRATSTRTGERHGTYHRTS